MLLDHSYPGNIRELENIIEHAFVLCTDSIIGVRHLPAGIVTLSRKHGTVPAVPDGSGMTLDAVDRLDRNESLYWRRSNGTTTTAGLTAEELGMHKTTLFRKLHRLGIKLPDRRRTTSL